MKTTPYTHPKAAARHVPVRRRFCRIQHLFVLLFLALPASAHEGPPFPIIVDHPMGSAMVSVWTDPDIGTGTFFVVLELPDGRELAPIHSIVISVRPQDGHQEEKQYTAEPQDVRYGARYYAEVPFDKGGLWDVRVLIDTDAGPTELTAEVEATPDGTLGPISLILYMLPFLAVAFIWIKAVMHRRALAAHPE